MRRLHVLIAALAVMAGFAVAMGASAASYQELGTVADGVYVVQSDEGRFRVEAVDAVTVVVYNLDGDLIVARSLGPGQARGFIVSDGSALVAIGGGEAAVAAKGKGQVTPVGIVSRAVTLVEAEGAVDETVTVQLPRFLVGVGGRLEGQAADLLIEATSDKGLVFRYNNGVPEVYPEAIVDGIIDVHVLSSDLQGRVALTLFLPDFETIAVVEPIGKVEVEPVEADPHERIPIQDLEYTPMNLQFDGSGAIVVELAEGYLLDMSLFDGSGAQIDYVHRGADLLQTRSWCRDVTDCFGGWTHSRDALAPETIRLDLEAGQYTFFIRMAAVEAEVTFENLAFLEKRELALVDGSAADDAAYQLEAPLLDIWLHSRDTSVSHRVEILLNENVVYSYESTAALFGARVDSNESYDPSLLGSGSLAMTSEGFSLDGAYFELVTVGGPLEEDEEEDEEDEAP